MAPCSSNADTPAPCVVRPPSISTDCAEPPGLTLKAVAASFITAPLTSESPVPPNVSTPRWRAFAARRQADQVGADGHALVRLHVPQRERALQDMDAEADRPVGISACVRAHDVQAVDVDMAALHGVSRQELHLSGDADVGQPHAPEAGDGRVVEDGALVGRRRQLQPADFVVGTE